MGQSPSIIKLIEPIKTIDGGGDLGITTNLNGETSPAVNYIYNFEKYLTPNIIQSFKNPDIIGGGSINSGTPFGFFEDNVITQGGIIENNDQIYNFIIQLQLI